MISAISRTSVREIRPRTLCSRRRRTVESFLLSRHHLGLSCVANAFTLSAATQLRLSNEDEDDEEGEDDERAEGQGRGRGGGGLKGGGTPYGKAEGGGASLSALFLGA